MYKIHVFQTNRMGCYELRKLCYKKLSSTGRYHKQIHLVMPICKRLLKSVSNDTHQTSLHYYKNAGACIARSIPATDPVQEVLVNREYIMYHICISLVRWVGGWGGEARESRLNHTFRSRLAWCSQILFRR